ncbi:hypothetical protein SLEP1_g47289 [Rubroshorea leprosula]|uniref:Transposase n=1 Tax=Rubroshorea leprosula TaxID=152421 RepID=A0AAV5LQ13_9ROSI|nr:hypothetical protein SLEP1_g47289 [Rubroshorea leprosula]
MFTRGVERVSIHYGMQFFEKQCCLQTQGDACRWAKKERKHPNFLSWFEQFVYSK